MDKTEAWAFLRSVWAGINLNSVICCHCEDKISPDGVLARTFSLESLQSTKERRVAQKIPVPALSDTILVYHRHLHCLFQSTKYVAISHVWHRQVADLQYKKLQAKSSVIEVEDIVREVPARIARSLATNLGGGLEIWHDYISVPQWTPRLKTQIILAIPELYGRALTTVAYLSDIGPDCIVSMRHGRSLFERCCGISDLCNAKWFSRVWTAMELTQSRELRAMLSDFTLVSGDSNHQPFTREMSWRWEVENAAQGNSYNTERLVGMGDNLVPWQLGPLMEVRDRNLRGIRTPFATAHELLVRRCVTITRDFFHAFLAVLKLDVTEAELSPDTAEAILQVARRCMKAGDFSPLLIIPSSAQAEVNEAVIQSYGYLDLGTFALSEEECGPTYPEVRLESGHPVILAENLGTVQFIRRMSWKRRGPQKSLAILVRLTLEVTGLNVEDFVTTLGVRLYGQELQAISDRLSQDGRMQLLRQQLSKLYDAFPIDSDDIAAQISQTIGLSDRSLGGGHIQSQLSPVSLMEGHSGTIHLGDSGAAVGVKCPVCRKTFLLLVALLKPASSLLGTTAYRIPGLRYRFTHEGGCGFLLEGGRIVGRFVWGTPTCDCPKLEEVEIILEDLPIPRPNNFNYGHKRTAEWHPLMLEDRVKIERTK